MKNVLFLLFVLCYYIGNAQTKEKEIYLDLTANVGNNIGLSFEDYIIGDKPIFKDYKQSTLVNVFYSFGTLESNSAFVSDIDGTGWSVEVGYRLYFNKTDFKGFYVSNYFIGGNLKFEENNIGLSNVDFDGAYRYFSFLTPEIGYKFLFGDFSLKIGAGASWIIELGSKGDVSNDSFDDFVPRLSFGIGYSF